MDKRIIGLWCAAFLATGAIVFAAEKVTAGDPSEVSRNVSYHAGDIVPLSVEKGYVTLIELPDGDNAVVPICGDCKQSTGEGKISESERGDWIVEALPNSNLVSVQAWKIGGRTDVHIVGSSGTVYSFELNEISGVANAHADVRVRLANSNAGAHSAIPVGIKYVSASTADQLRADAANARQELKDEQDKSAAAKEQARKQLEAGIKHTYTFEQNAKAQKTFNVQAIYEDNGFTVIEANPQEAPSLYEIRDGKDSLVQFTLTNGKYVAPKIIDDGYLRVGKSKLTFHREAKNG